MRHSPWENEEIKEISWGVKGDEEREFESNCKSWDFSWK